jgi:hypothetical protein
MYPESGPLEAPPLEGDWAVLGGRIERLETGDWRL